VVAQHVCNGALLKCSFGLAPSTLVVLPTHRTLTGGQPAANILDYVPMLNIMPFSMCSAPTNPAVIAATAAAAGVFTPAPCVPAIPGPWVPGAPTVFLNGLPALNNTSTVLCAWAGVITVAMPGQFTEMVP
jgi:hypothetical protein